MTLQTAKERLDFFIENAPTLFALLDDVSLNEKPNPLKWSKKEILGHLVDSAANNNQRFIRSQYLEDLTLVYDQNQWVKHSHYQYMDKEQLFDFWLAYNKHIRHIIQHFEEQNLKKLCITSTPEPLTVEALFIDYVSHMAYHMAQIIE